MNMEINKITQGDTLEVLKTWPDESIDCIVTSPPYWNLRSYLSKDHPDKPKEIGLEPTFKEYLDRLFAIFEECKRVLKDTGTCFVNLGDTYGTGSGKDENRIHAKQGTLKGWINGRGAVRGYEKSLL